MIDVCLLGTGGMMPLPYRSLTSMMLRYNGSSILLDCGEATQIAVRRRGWSFNPIDLILITHFHADHISGLPGMLLAMGNADRTEPVILVGPPGLERIVRSLLVIAPRLPFKLEFIELEDIADVQTLNLLGLEIHAFRLQHSMLCYGYSFTLHRAGKFNPAAAKALGLPVNYWGKLQRGDTVSYEGKEYTPDLVMGGARKGLKIAYATDTRPIAQISKEASGADLFICEGMYGDGSAESDHKAREKKHMTMQEAASLAANAEIAPEKMWFTHYSPSFINPQDYEESAKSIFPAAEVVKDRASLVLDFEED